MRLKLTGNRLSEILDGCRIAFGLNDVQLLGRLARGFGGTKLLVRCSRGLLVFRIYLRFQSAPESARLREQIVMILRDAGIRCPEPLVVTVPVKIGSFTAIPPAAHALYSGHVIEVAEFIQLDRRPTQICDWQSLADLTVRTVRTLSAHHCREEYILPRYSDADEARRYLHSRWPFTRTAMHVQRNLDAIGEIMSGLAPRALASDENSSVIHGDLKLANIGFVQKRPEIILDLESVRPGIAAEDAVWMIESVLRHNRRPIDSQLCCADTIWQCVGNSDRSGYGRYLLIHRHLTSLAAHARSWCAGCPTPKAVVTDHWSALTYMMGEGQHLFERLFG